MRVGFVSLGCSKNLVDTEMAIGLMKKLGFEIVSDPSQAEMIIINTCGFIQSAKEEAIQTIFEMAEYKNNNCKYLVVMGCLVKRYKEELVKEIPEVDLFISIEEYDQLANLIMNLINPNENIEKSLNTLDYFDRIISTGSTTAFLKIAEGCSNNCTYCAIPKIRGKYESRKFEDIVNEAKQLASQGIRELIVIAQDTTKYGFDLYGKYRLAELLEELSKIEEIEWIRFLYSYPESIDDNLINVVKNNDKICKYFDIPIQHYSNTVLKRMNRKTSSEDLENVISKIRKNIPEVIIRTTVMVGFPDESEEDFDALLNFIKKAKFDKLGCFMYSKEDGTPASNLTDSVPKAVKLNRYRTIMTEQAKISLESLKEKIGKEFEVLIEDYTEDGRYLIGRTYMDIPEEDGVIYIDNTPDFEIIIGEFYQCIVDDIARIDPKDNSISNYDLIGHVII